VLAAKGPTDLRPPPPCGAGLLPVTTGYKPVHSGFAGFVGTRRIRPTVRLARATASDEIIERVNDRAAGVPARVAFNPAPPARGSGLEPERVEHLQLGITWRVTEILDRWQHPGRVQETWGRATVAKWWLLKVSGPLPGRPGVTGEFVMEISAYGHRSRWWITVEPLADPITEQGPGPGRGESPARGIPGRLGQIHATSADARLPCAG